jgi:hypothetical protein
MKSFFPVGLLASKTSLFSHKMRIDAEKQGDWKEACLPTSHQLMSSLVLYSQPSVCLVCEVLSRPLTDV